MKRSLASMSACEALKAATAFLRTATSRVCPWCAQTVMVVAALLPGPAEAPTATVRTTTGTTAMTAHATFLLRIMCAPFVRAEVEARSHAPTRVDPRSAARLEGSGGLELLVSRDTAIPLIPASTKAKSNQHGAIIAPHVAMSSDWRTGRWRAE